MFTYLRCPTCISLAIFGAEKSTIIFNFFFNGGGLIPSFNTFVINFNPKFLSSHILIKPGPAISVLLITSFDGKLLIINWATSLGAFFIPIKNYNINYKCNLKP